MTLDDIKFIASLPFGLVLAYVIMRWKRADDQAYQASQAAVLEKVLVVVGGVTEALKALQVQMQMLSTISKLEEEVKHLKEKLK